MPLSPRTLVIDSGTWLFLKAGKVSRRSIQAVAKAMHSPGPIPIKVARCSSLTLSTPAIWYCRSGRVASCLTTRLL